MAMRIVHARVRARRQLELVEDLDLPEGSEVTLTLELGATLQVSAPTPDPRPTAALELGTYPLGAPRHLTRSDFYDDDR